MKRITHFALFLLLALASCKKGDTGPAGKDGIDGLDGVDGVDGNANVTQYTFGASNLAIISFAQLAVSTTKDTMDKSTWLVYLYYQPLARWYFMPGSGVGGNTAYRVSMGYSANKVNIYIDKNGPGENYSESKVIRIYNSNTIPGGRMADPYSLPVNVTDYEAVKRYYNL